MYSRSASVARVRATTLISTIGLVGLAVGPTVGGLVLAADEPAALHRDPVDVLGAVLALVLLAAGMRVLGVVADVDVLRGLPTNRTTIGAALVDTATEVASGVGLAVAGTTLAALLVGDLATSAWSRQQAAQFEQAVTVPGVTLTVLAGAPGRPVDRPASA